MSKRGWLITIGVYFGIIVLAGGAAAWYFYAQYQAAKPERARVAALRAADKADADKRSDRRLFLEDHRLDDNARDFILRSTLKQSGERCDKIERMLMSKPGVWRVECAPGYVYLFAFDDAGGLISAAKVN